jgi:hypothetical protein
MTDTDAIAVATPVEEDRGAEGVLGRLADWGRAERRMRAVACVRNGWSYDTWDRGRFLEESADPRAVRALRDLFGRDDRADLRRSLWASIERFRWLGMETAAGLGYRYPRETDEEVTRWVERLRSQEIATASPAG